MRSDDRIAGADLRVMVQWMEALGATEPGDFSLLRRHPHGGLSEGSWEFYFKALEHPDSPRFITPMARFIQGSGAQVSRIRERDHGWPSELIVPRRGGDGGDAICFLW